jgi:hypothetical protein
MGEGNVRFDATGRTAVTARTGLKTLFAAILISLAVYTSWASTQQAVWEWRGLLVAPDRWWTIATLIDAYFGFIIFYAWVFYKEPGSAARLGWFVAIMLLGNMATAGYLLRDLSRLKPGDDASAILLRRGNDSRVRPA